MTTKLPYYFINSLERVIYQISDQYQLPLNDRDELLLFTCFDMVFSRSDNKSVTYKKISEYLKTYYLSGIAV